jgi:hypothetical protein
MDCVDCQETNQAAIGAPEELRPDCSTVVVALSNIELRSKDLDVLSACAAGFY